MFLFTEDDANGLIFVIKLYMAVEVIDVHLHLAQVLVREFSDLQIDQHVAAKQPVIEDQIDKEMLLVEGEAFLPGLEEKALAQLQKEMFQLVDDCYLQIGFGISVFSSRPRNSST